MTECRLCNKLNSTISKELKVCLRCIKDRPKEALSIAKEAHRRSRILFGLPTEPPKDTNGVPCNLCVNECVIPENGISYCGLRENRDGSLIGVTPTLGKLSWYHDPLPTNCVGDWVCPGGTGIGFPQYAYTQGAEYGYKNLAVFFHACSFNCLFCQNWHFKKETFNLPTVTIEDLVLAVNRFTSCICYFGGDPAPQLPFAIRAAKLALERKNGKILRICWETNGSMNTALLHEMYLLSNDSGGCIKFDLKALDENLHIALTDITNKRTLANFKMIAEKFKKSPPNLIANTLLIPGYVEKEEVEKIAEFIASINPDIPYSILAFYPHFFMSDLPFIKKEVADECLKIAKSKGLNNVRIGNIHLLR
ncbi:MAG: radical SAM protein [Thermodesulfovibrionales bacterium]|nr:radical SAM protein [Thermodesulfovibrionales bacterium]